MINSSNHTHASSPFVFDLNFDVDENRLKHLTDHEEPAFLYTQEHLDLAVSQAFEQGKNVGFEEGYVQGEIKAITRRQLEIQEAFIKIYKSLDEILIHEQKIKDTIIPIVQDIVQTMIKKIFPYYCEKYSYQELFHGIQQILDTLIEPEPVKIYLSPMTFIDLRDQMIEIQKKFQSHIDFESDDTLENWDCRLEWKGGGARFEYHQILKAIEKIYDQTNLTLEQTHT